MLDQKFRYGDWEESEDGGTHFQLGVDIAPGVLGAMRRWHPAGHGPKGCPFCKEGDSDAGD